MTDEEIVEMYLSRNPTALNVTAEKYGGFLYAISMNVIHSRADAEECVTDAYLACWNTIPPEKPRSLKAYAGALCRNISFDRYKRAHAQKRGGGKVETLLSEVEEFLPAEGFGSDYGEDKAAEVINEFLSRLEKEERIVFVRRYWFSDTVKDIAERMGFSESKVKSLLFRLRKKLKEKLVKDGIGVLAIRKIFPSLTSSMKNTSRKRTPIPPLPGSRRRGVKTSARREKQR